MLGHLPHTGTIACLLRPLSSIDQTSVQHCSDIGINEMLEYNNLERLIATTFAGRSPEVFRQHLQDAFLASAGCEHWTPSFHLGFNAAWRADVSW